MKLTRLIVGLFIGLYLTFTVLTVIAIFDIVKDFSKTFKPALIEHTID